MSRWRMGHSIPSSKCRLALEQVFGIPEEAWKMPLDEGEEMPAVPRMKTGKHAKGKPKPRPAHLQMLPPPPTSPKPEPEEPEYEEDDPDLTPMQSVERSLREVRAELKAQENPMEKNKLRVNESRLMNLLFRMQKEEELSEERYVKAHPEFKRLVEQIKQALTPYPEALDAVVRAINPEHYGEV